MGKVICIKCGKNIEHNEVALCKKFFGTKTEKKYCLNCLADVINVNTATLQDRIIYYRNMGCQLFE